MRVIVETLDGERLWERTPEGGVTSTSYAADGTLEKIVTALEEALLQARGETSSLDDAHPVADVGITAAEIERDVPPTGAGRGNASR